MTAVLLLVGLAVPLGHVLKWHGWAARLARPGMVVPQTPHERSHAARSGWRHHADTTGWMVYLAAVIIAAVFLS